MAPTRGALAGPRVLLRKLREVMAEPIGAQQRLDKVVTLIAANMVAEVCSVYVLRADNVLELYATEGLKASSVHRATLDRRPRPRRPHRRGGAAAQPPRRAGASGLRLPAGDRRGDLPLLPRRAGAARRAHARRARRAEPLLPHLHRGGDRGAADHRHGARRDVRLRRDGRHLDPGRRSRRQPAGASEGRGLRRRHRARPRRAARAARRRHRSSSPRTSSTSCAGSTRRWRASGSRSTIFWRAAPRPATGEHREILEAYKMFAEDRGWTRRLQEAIRNGLTAEAAVERVQNDTRAQMQRQTDPFLRDRLHDFDDLANRLLRELMGRPHGPFAGRPAGGRRHRRAQHGAGGASRLRPRARARPRARGGRRRPATSRSSRARSASPPSASSTTSSRSPRPATRSSSTATPARCISARRPTSRRPMPTRRASAPASRSSTGCSATSRR